ncbi:hypothetical protein Ddye_025817 [Dipteronia dyeriana]|uniref:Uncharacterized protein n=1 Tax=Dipteronia dyeriana TaxID=168575 RepID=A0AAD9TLK2_9ROSI|nr:hypothetical protein Ddye_025817 [Dipteronia dyeriana]
MQSSRRVIKEDHNKPKEKTTTRMALVDHFRNVEGHENHSMKRRVGLLLPTKLKRVGLKMISGVFGKKKAEGCCFSDSENGGEGNENVGAESADCKQCTTKSQQQQTSLELKVPAAKLQLSSFKNLFGNKKQVGFGFGFLRGKKGGSENGIGGRQESSGKLKRVSSRVAIQRLKIGGSMREKSSIQKIEEERVDEELCKKRILMGERCKPLNISGTLHYDQDGILLPDVLP